MLKRLSVALAALFVLLSPAYSAGVVPGFSLTTQYDLTGKVAPGCKLYVIQAGTTSTPQIAYQDSALTIPSPGGSVLTCDASARLPQFFLADGSIKFRLTTSGGTQIFVQDGLIVVGASSGGGGGSPVDPTTILTTGDIKTTYGTGIVTGFVRANGRTIGSATSGATERANTDCQGLFSYLWGVDPNLAVSTGRGVSAAADWSANKTIALPDFRSRALAGLADMGNTDNALFSGVTFTSGTSTTLGSLLGAARRTLTLAALPTGITSANPAAFSAGSTTGAIFLAPNGVIDATINTSGGTAARVANGSTASVSSITSTIAAGAAAVTSNNTGGSAFDSVSTYGLVTIYVKL